MTEIPLHYLMVNAKYFVNLRRQRPNRKTGKIKTVSTSILQYVYMFNRHISLDRYPIGYGPMYSMEYV